MKTLESGRVYDISLPGYNGDALVQSVLKDFINKHNDITGLGTTLEWSDGWEGDEWYGFYLPPIISNNYYKFSLYASRRYPQTIEYASIDLIGFDRYGADLKSKIPYACVYKVKNQNEYSYALGNDIQFTSDFYFRYDTRFLNSHHFYTINYFGCNKGTELDELYYAPLIFVYNDGTTNNDDVLIFNQNGSHNSYWDDPQFITEFNNIDNIYIPQLYTNQDKSIILQKSSMGSGRGSNKIYITNASKFTKLENLADYKKMAEYKDCWLKGKLYIEDNGLYNGKKFIMGVSSLKKFDYANPYDDEGGITTPYIPVIEGDNIPNAPIKPPYPSVDTKEDYLKFSSDGNFTLSVSHPGWDGTIEYSTDEGKTWTTWSGRKLNGNIVRDIYLRGSNNTKITGSAGGGGGSFQFTGKYCTGNIETLLDYNQVMNGQHPSMSEYCYSALFGGCTSLTEAPELPATTLTKYCYHMMFISCKSLTKAPKLPAITLADRCYQEMFEECTSLVEAPELFATTLADYCSFQMFYNCTSLIIPPKLSATTLAKHCYEEMFYNCTSLTKAPELRATTLPDSCYRTMFYKCTSLVEAPELPATTLADYCYYSMFYNCTLLKTPLKLSATTLVKYCYQNMFYNTNIILNSTRTTSYQYEYRIPTFGNGTGNLNYYMFSKGIQQPKINTTYYVEHEPI